MSDIPQNITLTHYIDNAILISPAEQEMASMFVPLAKHMCSKEWRWKIQSTSLLMNFLGIPEYWRMLEHSTQIKQQSVVSYTSHH